MHTLGPQDGTLLVHTGKGGAAAKAGHELTPHDVTQAREWLAAVPASTVKTASRPA